MLFNTLIDTHEKPLPPHITIELLLDTIPLTIDTARANPEDVRGLSCQYTSVRFDVTCDDPWPMTALDIITSTSPYVINPVATDADDDDLDVELEDDDEDDDELFLEDEDDDDDLLDDDDDLEDDDEDHD